MLERHKGTRLDLQSRRPSSSRGHTAPSDWRGRYACSSHTRYEEPPSLRGTDVDIQSNEHYTTTHDITSLLLIATLNEIYTVKQHYSGLVTVEHGITISKKMCEKRDNKPRNLVWINRLMTSSLSTEASFTSRTSSWTSKENRGPTNKKGSYFIIFQPALFQGSPQTFGGAAQNF